MESIRTTMSGCMGTGKPLVSVLMAVFNVGDPAILDLAVESIVRQDMEDWELLICDDGSTDGTYEKALEWEKRDDRIRVLRNTCNQKAAKARNRCLMDAQGRYVAIMDADDACSPNRLRVQSGFLDAHPQLSFVGIRGERFRETPGDLDKPYWFCAFPDRQDFLMTLPFVHASLMFRRQALLDVKGYDESLRVERSEDYDMLLRMYAKGMRGGNTADAVYYIREDDGAFRRRKYRYRIKEMMVKLRGFTRLGLMPKGLLYALKPLIVGLIPIRTLEWLKRRYYGRRMERS